MHVAFIVVEREDYNIVSFRIEGTLTPAGLRSLEPPQVSCQKGVVLNGRGPIWLYGYLVHHFHSTPWVATFDPRLNAGVVVESHTPKVRVGDLVTL